MNYYWYSIGLTIGYYYAQKISREAVVKINKYQTEKEKENQNQYP